MDKLNYSTNEDREEIISELKDNERNITEWNKFVDSFINKYINIILENLKNTYFFHKGSINIYVKILNTLCYE